MNFQSIKIAYHAAKNFGFGWTIRRLYYEFQLRTGHHKRSLPKRAWREKELQYWLKDDIEAKSIYATWRKSQPNFFFTTKNKTEIAAAIRSLQPSIKLQTDIHNLRYFSKLEYEVSYPDIWFTNPFLQPNVQCERDKHWSEYPMYSKQYEDLKFIWESGRFAIVYDLVRQYFLTNDENLAEQFWQLIESWIVHNPPNTGPHWKCGQETSLRLMTWYVGLFAFIDSPATTSTRFERFLGAVAAQVNRVAKDWKYSYMQQSNHAVSEGLGLYVTGVLFPQLKDAKTWREQGKYILEERSTFLFRSDGTYFQKSHNYLRFIVHAYLYVIRIAEVNDDDFSKILKDRMRAALDYLKSVLDEKSGFVPNFGSNDGALILPFNSCDFRDFRPTIAVLHYYFHQNRCFEQGAWHEDLIWLFGADAIPQKIEASPTPPSRSFDVSGIYTLRDKESWAFMHAETYKDRPAHADALHLDLWWRGINMACDPGTYLYYGHKPWLDAFKHTGFHNTLTVDGKDQMERAYRFTWAYWHACSLNEFRTENGFSMLEAEHNGYHRLADAVTHRRAVACVDDVWIVVDDVLGATTHQIDLHWMLSDFPCVQEEEGLELETPEGKFRVGILNISHSGNMSYLKPDVIHGDMQQSTAGLKSNYYGDVEPALSVRTRMEGTLPLRLVSILGEANWKLEHKEDKLILNQKTTFLLIPIGIKNIIREINSPASTMK